VRGPLRYLLSLFSALFLLVAVSWVSPIVGFVFIILAFGLLFEGGTAWFERAGRTGGLHDYHQ